MNINNKPSLRFVKAINFELTYKCNMSCPHCVQQKIRQKGQLGWLDTKKAIQVLKEGLKFGFVSSGVNFTGGEPFLPDSNLPQLVVAARSLNLTVRVNTNGWWGGKQDIRLGSLEFNSYRHVLRWLKKMEISVLALSFDRRYDENLELYESVVAVMRECENQGLHYQIVFTGSESQYGDFLRNIVNNEQNFQLDYMIPVEMELVDLGGASKAEDFDASSGSYCEGKGFYRPQFLHVSPTGGVRSCLYACGAQWLGNIHEQTLAEIVDGFQSNPVVRLFSDDDRNRESIVESLYSENQYQIPKHPCAFSIMVTRTAEKRFQLEKRLGRALLEEEFTEITAHIAKDLQLKK